MKKKGNLNYIRYLQILLLWVLVGIWMLIVFDFSNEVGEVSSGTSKKTIEYILDIFGNNVEKSDFLIESLQFVFRKLAHFILYFVGGILNYISFYYTNKKKNNISYKSVIYSLIFCFIYSIMDEIHQHFVPGRASRVMDVIIDTVGALFGISICKIIQHLLKNKK